MAVKLSLSGDLTIEREITLVQAGQIISFLGTGDALAVRNDLEVAQRDIHNPNLLVSETLDPVDVLKRSKASSNAQKITVFGYILSKKNSDGSFAADGIKSMFMRLGESVPKNLSRDIKEAVRQGYIFPDVDSDNLFCSEKGRAYVENGFDKAEVRKTGKHGKKAGSSKLGLVIRDEILNLQMISTLEGYPDLHSLKTRGQQILWILCYASENGIEDLNYREICHIAQKNRTNISGQNFTASNVQNIKAGYIMTDKGNYKVMQKGIEYIKGFAS